ncbi:MAG TPA: adenylyltransferase/cytidyltransferase family protein [Candidatus Saccharimonadales bacterium]
MIVKERDLPRLRQKHRNKDIILALGSFDLLHYGHIKYLEWCKHGDILVVAVNSDKEIRARKGNSRPIIGEEDRLKLLDALRPIDYALLAIWDGGTYDEVSYRIAERLAPDTVVLYNEYAHEVPEWSARVPGARIVIDIQLNNTDHQYHPPKSE